MTARQQAAAERKEWQAKLAAARAATLATVQQGTCPQCGSGLRRNLALNGWWQCEQYGDGRFRARPNEPQCSWQGFTD